MPPRGEQAGRMGCPRYHHVAALEPCPGGEQVKADRGARCCIPEQARRRREGDGRPQREHAPSDPDRMATHPAATFVRRAPRLAPGEKGEAGRTYTPPSNYSSEVDTDITLMT